MVLFSFVAQHTGQERTLLQTESVSANKDTKSSKTGNAGKNAHDRVGGMWSEELANLVDYGYRWPGDENHDVSSIIDIGKMFPRYKMIE